ncbi:MAG: MetQ/NlpA family ABC transporter substrate-binding protein [Proteobacteria bacterium]|nr:MetQ/NlpA family ABC transporter substrate-binding protein [Pseudomonadota bacterium]
MKKIILFLCSLLILISCQKQKVLRVGVTAGPHAMIMEEVKKQAEKEGLSIDIIEFNDFLLPNAALDQKDIDVNCYQHMPFLEEQKQTRGYKLKVLAKAVLMPMGIYSLSVSSLTQIPEDGKIAIPNDPTNGGRGLKLLEKAGLLTLKNKDNPTVLDIQDNPKNLQIIEVEAPQLPRLLEDISAAVINVDWIILANMDPSKALFKEDYDSPYMNVIVVRENDDNKPEIKKLVQLYQSPQTKSYIEKTFKGALLAGW